MIASQSTGEWGRLGDQECSEAGTFRLYGFRCINTVTPELHPPDATHQRSWRWCMQHFYGMDQFFRCTSTFAWIPAHAESVGSTNSCQSTSRHLFKTFFCSWWSSHSINIISSFRQMTYGSTYNVNWMEVDQMIQISVGFRLRLYTYEPHTCPYGREVDARGLHSLSCSQNTAWQQRHADFNDIIWKAIKRAQIPVAKELVILTRTNGKCPDGATLIPWSCGKPLAWNVTVSDTFVESPSQRYIYSCWRCCKQPHNSNARSTRPSLLHTLLHQLQSRSLERGTMRPSKPYKK